MSPSVDATAVSGSSAVEFDVNHFRSKSRSHAGRACNLCRARKTKCSPSKVIGTCAACLRLELVCSWEHSDGRRYRARQNEHSESNGRHASDANESPAHELSTTVEESVTLPEMPYLRSSVETEREMDSPPVPRAASRAAIRNMEEGRNTNSFSETMSLELNPLGYQRSHVMQTVSLAADCFCTSEGMRQIANWAHEASRALGAIGMLAIGGIGLWHYVLKNASAADQTAVVDAP